MNERQPYERLIADKLQRLPGPDADASWQKMKQLLDEEDSRKGGAGKKRPGSSWWGTGLLALLFISAIWFYTENKKPYAKEVAVQTQPDAASKSQNHSTINVKTISSDKTSTLQNSESGSNAPHSMEPSLKNEKTSAAVKNQKNSTVAKQSENIPLGTGKNFTTAAAPSGSTKESLSRNNPGIVSNKDNSKGNLQQSASLQQSFNNPEDEKSISAAGNPGFDKSRHHPKKYIAATAVSNPGSAEPGLRKNTNKLGTIGLPYSNDQLKKSRHQKIALKTDIVSNKPGSSKQGIQNNTPFLTGSGKKGSITGTVAPRQYNYQNNLPIPFIYTIMNPAFSTNDSIETSRNSTDILNKDTKALAVKAAREKQEELLAKKARRTFKLNLSNTFKPFSLKVNAEPWWAAGLSMSYTAPIGGQNSFHYSLNAKSGTIGDYIPSPFLQFHLNDYVYFHTELNLSAPQPIAPLQVYQQSAAVAGASGYSNQKTISIQKLYYFNWPISLHYSPVNNLYISAGVQFSSFQSGLAVIENKQYQTINPNNIVATDRTVEKFKDDSIAVKLNPTEWRWQAGLDYSWNRLGVGIRYNRSFKDLMNSSIPSSHPIISSRNSSLLFFVRYNLFESRNKGNAGSRRSLSRY